MKNSWSAFIFLIIAVGGESCNHADSIRIALPVCACIVRGAAWTKDPNPPKNTAIPSGEEGYWIHIGNNELTYLVNQLVIDANDKVWIPGAEIAMVAEIAKDDGYIKVIDDPDVSAGHYGDIESTPAGGELVAAKCREAWGASLVPDGLVIIVCRELINNDGSVTGQSGYAEPYYNILSPNRINDLCSFPRNNLTKNDVKGRYIVLEDPTLYGFPIDKGKGIPYVVLAHEFGHVLMLGHGNGLDDDANGTLPPNVGPRLFDQDCDPAEFNMYDTKVNTQSLMSPIAGYNKNITDLQKEIARTVAPLFPAAVGP